MTALRVMGYICYNLYVTLHVVMVVQDQSMIFAYLHGMEALANLREPALRALCSSVRYEWHDANEIIYWSVGTLFHLLNFLVCEYNSNTNSFSILTIDILL